MKKWLIGCLMILLFAASPALAAHNRADGSVCNSAAYIGLRDKNENQEQNQESYLWIKSYLYAL